MTEQIIPIPADTKYFTPTNPFRLECGVEIPLTIAYHTYGTFTGDNALWVCHALTANSEVADWWPHTVEAGKFLDPHNTECSRICGSPVLSSGGVRNPTVNTLFSSSFSISTSLAPLFL